MSKRIGAVRPGASRADGVDEAAIFVSVSQAGIELHADCGWITCNEAEAFAALLEQAADVAAADGDIAPTKPPESVVFRLHDGVFVPRFGQVNLARAEIFSPAAARRYARALRFAARLTLIGRGVVDVDPFGAAFSIPDQGPTTFVVGLEKP